MERDAAGRTGPSRVVVALGGNAMTSADGSATPEAQEAAARLAMDRVARLLAAGHQVVVTHGNGPQVGNLLVQNERARSEVPALPLDWCVAQTQATIGMLLVDALERALAAHGLERRVAAVLTRVLVDADDPGWENPTKPVGEYVDERLARAGMARGEAYQDRGERGWRRVVPSPEPRELLDRAVITRLFDEGVVVVAAGGGGIPMVREAGGHRGVEAVLDKDLTAVLLADAVGADCLVIATDVDQASTGFGTPLERPIGKVTPSELRELAAAGHFAGGSMGPKVEAAVRFVEGAATAPPPARAGAARRAVITSLDRVADAVTGKVGTVVEPAEP